MKKNKNNIIKYNLLELNHLNQNFIKLISRNAINEKVLIIHQNITEKYSHLQFLNELKFYSKKISFYRYKKNKKKIKSFESNYYNSCRQLIINAKNYSNSKYLEYINTLFSSKNGNFEYIDYYNRFYAPTVMNGKKIKIKFLNIYDLIDSCIPYSQKKKIYNDFSDKIKINEYKFERNILEIVNKNLKVRDYILSSMDKYGIKNNFFKIATRIIEKSEIIPKYTVLKKELLKNNDLFHLSLFSYNYNSEQKFKFDLNEIPEIFSGFKAQYIKIILKIFDEKIFVNKNIQNKGLTITDLSGNGFILLQNFDVTNIDSVFIIFHELGHLLYCYCSENKLTTGQDIIFSEISALTNELILNDYLIEKQILNNNLYFLDSFFKILVKGVESYKLLNSIYNLKHTDYHSIKNEYYKILNKLYKDEIIIEDGNIDFIIDNFILNDMYYLKYLIALIISTNIFIRIKNNPNGINDYMNFLRYSSLYTNIFDALKVLCIDLNEEKTYKNVIDYFSELISKMDK